VKCWNVDELQAYAELVSLGNPDFIEVKVSSAAWWWAFCSRGQLTEGWGGRGKLAEFLGIWIIDSPGSWLCPGHQTQHCRRLSHWSSGLERWLSV
jgi:hypothetical protein